MKKRRRCAIIRSHKHSLENESESYYHSLLMLYNPWFDEDKDLKEGTSYEAKYQLVTNTVKANQQRYEFCREEVDRAYEDYEEYGVTDDAWLHLAAQAEQVNKEDMQSGSCVGQFIVC